MEALAVRRPASPAWFLVRRPLVWATTTAVVASTGILAGTLSAIVVLGSTIGVAFAGIQSKRVRSWLERAIRRNAQRAQRERREERLEKAEVTSDGLVAATMLVDEIMASNPALATRLELDAMLDRYVELEIALAGYRNAIDRGPTWPLPSNSSTMRNAIRERARAFGQACVRRIEALHEERECIFELLQLAAQRGSVNDLGDGHDAAAERIDECLALLADYNPATALAAGDDET